MTIEFCVDSYLGALAAKSHGVKRIELCSALSVGGLSPSIGLVIKCAEIKEVETHVMIRPVEGNFVYDNDIFEAMLQEIICLKNTSAKGVVFGCLNKEGEIHIEQNKILIEKAKTLGLETTFHRAFDQTNNPTIALKKLIALGFDRVLTSGTKKNAQDGSEIISKLVHQAKGQIQIMAGCGVNENNVEQIAQTGVDAIHFTIHKKQKQMNEMGVKNTIDEKKIKNILKQFNS
ncbi:MAG: copper homeostasis protein CutC [Crocinitomicaceae bacterium]|nr:copper homeostasis protein CutC [Crocinitomicaceae bacterium]